MASKFLAAGTLLTLLGLGPVEAVSVTNRDETDHKLTIIEGESQSEHRLAPTTQLEGVCLKGCVIRMNDSENDEYELDGTEIVSIEDGYLYYDGPDPAAPAAPSEPPPKRP